MVMICVGRGGSIDVGSKWKMIVRKKKYKIDLPVFSLRYVSLFLASWYLSAFLGSPSTTQDIFFVLRWKCCGSSSRAKFFWMAHQLFLTWQQKALFGARKGGRSKQGEELMFFVSCDASQIVCIYSPRSLPMKGQGQKLLSKPVRLCASLAVYIAMTGFINGRHFLSLSVPGRGASPESLFIFLYIL